MKKTFFVLVVILFISACTNKIEEAKKLIEENKSEEAISILSQVEATDKQYSEAQKLIKLTKSKILFLKGCESLENYEYDEALKYFKQVVDDGKSFPGLKSKILYLKAAECIRNAEYEEALKYFEQVEEDKESFPSLKLDIEETKASIELFKNLPGTYEGQATPYLGGAYMIINTKMKILNNLAYTIQEQMTDTYVGGSYRDLFSGQVKSTITKFRSGDYGFILKLSPWGSPYKKNDFSVYFYRYKNFWRLQFNLEFTWGSSTQEYTINLFREATQEETSNNDNIQNSAASFIKEDVQDFITSFINYVNDKNISGILNCYANEVDYFGKGEVDKNFIRKDKDDYFKKWDDVKYQMEDNSLSITDLADNSKLAVFNFEYSVYSSERNKQLGGIAQSKIKIRQGENGLEIFDEKQKILAKNL
jgi:hypothetical protein